MNMDPRVDLLLHNHHLVVNIAFESGGTLIHC